LDKELSENFEEFYKSCQKTQKARRSLRKISKDFTPELKKSKKLIEIYQRGFNTRVEQITETLQRIKNDL